MGDQVGKCLLVEATNKLLPKALFEPDSGPSP